MRSLVVAFGLLLLATPVDAKPKQGSKAKVAAVSKTKRGGAKRHAAKHHAARRTTKKQPKKQPKKKQAKQQKRVSRATKRIRRFVMPRGPVRGQSLGAPWAGRLREATQLREGPGYYIRRPWRAFGTAITVETVGRIVSDVADRYFDTHAIAIGDLSAEHGGRISDHSSHQSGRDVDIGLIFKQQPDSYPQSFVVGTADTLDLEATFVLVEEFAKTVDDPAGVQVIFLDYDVQGLLYHWALANDETPEYLAKLFQFPHGRGQSAGIVRHEPNHADHIHVRFRCPPSDPICR